MSMEIHYTADFPTLYRDMKESVLVMRTVPEIKSPSDALEYAKKHNVRVQRWVHVLDSVEFLP